MFCRVTCCECAQPKQNKREADFLALTQGVEDKRERASFENDSRSTEKRENHWKKCRWNKTHGHNLHRNNEDQKRTKPIQLRNKGDKNTQPAYNTMSCMKDSKSNSNYDKQHNKKRSKYKQSKMKNETRNARHTDTIILKMTTRPKQSKPTQIHNIHSNTAKAYRKIADEPTAQNSRNGQKGQSENSNYGRNAADTEYSQWQQGETSQKQLKLRQPTSTATQQKHTQSMIASVLRSSHLPCCVSYSIVQCSGLANNDCKCVDVYVCVCVLGERARDGEARCTRPTICKR